MTKKDKLNLSYYIREFNLENDMRLNLDLENSHLIEKLQGKYIYIKIDVPNMGSFESLGQKMNKLEEKQSSKNMKYALYCVLYYANAK